MLLTQYSNEEFALLMQQMCEAAYRKVQNEITFSPSQYTQKEYLTEPEAREFLGGISRSTFHKLKKEGRFDTYLCGEGRCLYSREELVAYLKGNKSSSKHSPWDQEKKGGRNA